MKKIGINLLWLIAGIVISFAGVVAMFTAETAIPSLTIVFGMSVLIAAILHLVLYFGLSTITKGSYSLLSESAALFLLGGLILANTIETATVLPYILALWVVYSGITRFVVSVEYRRFNISHWQINLIISLAVVAVGYLSLFAPVMNAFQSSFVIGYLFLIQGLQLVASYFFGNVSA